MPAASVALRSRRRRRTNRPAPRTLRTLRNVGLIIVTASTLLLGAGFTSLANTYLKAAADLPSASVLPSRFGPVGQETFRPARLFDRTGRVLLFELIHPLAATRQWQPLRAMPTVIADATIAALDPTFRSDRGVPQGGIGRPLLAVFTGNAVPDQAPTLTERLVEQALTAPEDLQRSAAARRFRVALLAGEAARLYSPDQLLEWFLNSADYGQLAFGVDAAALVYFGKHADALTLAEAAMLASLPAHPHENPVENPAAAEAHRVEVLRAMQRLGWLTPAEAEGAVRESVTVRGAEARQALDRLGFVVRAWDELKTRLGPALSLQGGLTVLTTLDTDLQVQTDCVVRTQLARLAGGDATAVEPAADGSACIAAGLLPLLRPGDTQVDHGVDRAAAVVLDATTGEILALSGPSEETRPGGTAFDPFIYLTAFAGGYTPATMVIDAPTAIGATAAGTVHGPTRMRLALANSYPYATERVLTLAGADNVTRTAAQMGLLSLDPSDETGWTELASGDLTASLTEMTYGYTALANRGVLHGVLGPERPQTLAPYLVQSVFGPDGGLLYTAQTGSRVVVSDSLAYLMENVLSDQAARGLVYGQGNPLDIGRPAGVQVGQTSTGADNWALGFTPNRVVGVRVGSADGERMEGVNALNGATPIWQALLRYATRALPPAGWDAPAGISFVDVCDPSGYLPTPYCPDVVREVFPAGTEPTHVDTFYQPYQINRETGKLATLFTPTDLIEDRVFFVPPPEAEPWARQAGIETPPTEYDTYAPPPGSPEVSLPSPEPFALVRGRVALRGSAEGDGFDVYRLRYGQGLNPRAWVQIGEDGHRPIHAAMLGTWDTHGLDGLYTLQLMVVRVDGAVEVAYIPVTIDNVAPAANLVLPAADSVFTWPETTEVLIQVEVSDANSVVKVEFYIDGKRISTVAEAPWSFRWPVGAAGRHTLQARVTDAAGNTGESQSLDIIVER